MIDLHALPLAVTLPACFAAGFLLGLAYFHALRRTADLILRGGQARLGLALTLGRFAGLGLGFYLIVQIGGAALLAALIGVLAAKSLMLSRTRTQAP